MKDARYRVVYKALVDGRLWVSAPLTYAEALRFYYIADNAIEVVKVCTMPKKGTKNHGERST